MDPPKRSRFVCGLKFRVTSSFTMQNISITTVGSSTKGPTWHVQAIIPGSWSCRCSQANVGCDTHAIRETACSPENVPCKAKSRWVARVDKDPVIVGADQLKHRRSHSEITQFHASTVTNHYEASYFPGGFLSTQSHQRLVGLWDPSHCYLRPTLFQTHRLRWQLFLHSLTAWHRDGFVQC